MNDGQKNCEVTTDGRRGFEVLMRKLLSYPRAPAVIVLHWWSPLTQVGTNCCIVIAPPVVQYSPGLVARISTLR